MATQKKNGFWKRIRRIVIYLWLVNIGYILLTKFLFPPITTVMIGSLLAGHGLHRDYVTNNYIGKNAKLAVLSAEDQLFAEHNGFDVKAIKKALEYNNNPKHKKIKGASTISQQTAKNVFLWNGRNWIRKGLEVYHTFLIEIIWGKKRILETYLNVAEMGEGIFGIEAAAQHYYKKSANQLTRTEAAWIATILPNPILYSLKNPTPAMHRKQHWIVRQMNNLESDPAIAELVKSP
jgi:monofunctional biosynthetic peptidoglycan transglycosylase